MLQHKAMRDELLYADDKKKGDRGEDAPSDEKAPVAAIVAH